MNNLHALRSILFVVTVMTPVLINPAQSAEPIKIRASYVVPIKATFDVKNYSDLSIVEEALKRLK